MSIRFSTEITEKQGKTAHKTAIVVMKSDRKTDEQRARREEGDK